MVKATKPHFNEKTIIAVQKFVNSRSWKEAKQMVENNKRILLSKEADAVFAEMIRKYSRSFFGNEVMIINEHRELLKNCRIDSIEAAFAPYMPKK